MTAPADQPQKSTARLALGALGVVFGDLGTSPLYTMRECFTGHHGVAPTDANVLGVLSLVFWSLMMVITLKYLVFLTRADNRGEGGIMALLALAPARHRSPAPGRIGFVAFLVIAGAALLFGDGIITPAVSVLSAIEGLGVATTKLQSAVVPITVGILIGLFAVQRHGTGHLGRLFGPVMLLWFLTIAVLGGVHVARAPYVLHAISPTHAAHFFAEHGFRGITILGGVVLCVTGGEALYADLGHFGRRPIRDAWVFVCLPALVLSYFGQGALLISDPHMVARAAIAAAPFYSMCPPGVWLYAVVVIATLATIIASQALISGVYSLTHQAIQLGYFPRLTVRHTSSEAEGQIYLPLMNWIVASGCLALVLVYRESAKLAAAYGLAVSGTMAITTVVSFYVVHYTWRWPVWKTLSVITVFFVIDLAFLVANTLKFFYGGYVPFAVGVVFVVIMVTWYIGRSLLRAHFASHAVPLDVFLARLESHVDARPAGVAVFLTSMDGVPPAMRRVVSRFRALQQTVVILTVSFEHMPRLDAPDRVAEATELGHGFYRVRLHYGFMEAADVPRDLAEVLPTLGVHASREELAYVLAHETFVATPQGKMGRVLESIFAFLSRNARNATDYFGLPAEQVIEVGVHIDL